MMIQSSTSVIAFDWLRRFSSELRTQSPQWAERLDQVKTEQDLRILICDLFNLKHAIPIDNTCSITEEPLSVKIAHFIKENFHRGLTLKVLADFLGYSEKYCSDLFYRIMGESFSQYIKRHKIQRANSLLTTTSHTLTEIAAALGFSDQFAFSHFFKRATGHAPMEIRPAQARRRHEMPVRTRHTSP